MFWEMYQQSNINAAAYKANLARQTAEKTASQSATMHELLESRIESLALTCQALFEIMEARDGVTKEMLAAKMEEIDLRDGKLDGRMSPPNKVCSNCGRRTSKTRSSCLYCGGACVAE